MSDSVCGFDHIPQAPAGKDTISPSIEEPGWHWYPSPRVFLNLASPGRHDRRCAPTVKSDQNDSSRSVWNPGIGWFCCI